MSEFYIPNSANVEKPSSWNIAKVIIRTIAVKKYVTRSHKNAVTQNITTLTPLTN